ncbi:hypothetical protein D3C80_1414920 [compost metagenome]
MDFSLADKLLVAVSHLRLADRHATGGLHFTAQVMHDDVRIAHHRGVEQVSVTQTLGLVSLWRTGVRILSGTNQFFHSHRVESYRLNRSVRLTPTFQCSFDVDRIRLSTCRVVEVMEQCSANHFTRVPTELFLQRQRLVQTISQPRHIEHMAVVMVRDVLGGVVVHRVVPQL